MPTVVFKKDGSAMVHYTKQELHEFIEQSRRPPEKTEAQKIMERSK